MQKMIHVIDYGRGNLKSVFNAFRAIGQDVTVTDCSVDLKNATAIVLPGVGAFDDGIRGLRSRGFVDVLNEIVVENEVPFLGICLGMQFLAHRSEEGGKELGLGWIDAEVRRIRPKIPDYKVPHMGWNRLEATRESTLLEGLDKAAVYFVHSYQLEVSPSESQVVTATTDHGGRLTAAVQKEHIFGVQFHPEKSQGGGLKILENFALWGRDPEPVPEEEKPASVSGSLFQSI
jgi:glutamine amidotransferase